MPDLYFHCSECGDQIENPRNAFFHRVEHRSGVVFQCSSDCSLLYLGRDFTEPEDIVQRRLRLIYRHLSQDALPLRKFNEEDFDALGDG